VFHDLVSWKAPAPARHQVTDAGLSRGSGVRAESRRPALSERVLGMQGGAAQDRDVPFGQVVRGR
jgi:hypothetical protein